MIINSLFDSPSSPSLRVERDDNVEDVIRVSNPENKHHKFLSLLLADNLLITSIIPI